MTQTASGAELDLPIRKGKTFQRVFRWETGPVIYKTITDVDKSAPVRITAAGHGVRDGWRVAVSNVGGMREINPKDANRLTNADYRRATRIDANTVDLNSLDATGFGAYTSGGVLRYNTPASLAGYTAELQVRDRVGGTLLYIASDGGGEIVLDDTEHTITLTIPALDTEAFDFTRAIYELEMTGPTGVVATLVFGNVIVTEEVTV